MHYIIKIFCVLLLLNFSACKENTSVANQDQNTIEAVDRNSPTENQSDETVEGENDALVTKLKQFLTTEFLTENDLRAIKDDQRQFQFHRIDLNNDGHQEIFVNFGTSYFCGTGGCTVLLLSNDLQLITRFSPIKTIYIETSTKNEWRTLVTKVGNEWKQLVYRDGTYPSNPTIVNVQTRLPDSEAEILFDPNQTTSKTYTF